MTISKGQLILKKTNLIHVICSWTSSG